MSKTNPHLIVESGGVDNLGADFNSDYFILGKCGKVGVQVRANNDDHVGTVTMQVSNDATNWTALSNTTALASGSAKNDFHTIDTSACYIRANYARTSGDGQLEVICNKRVNS